LSRDPSPYLYAGSSQLKEISGHCYNMKRWVLNLDCTLWFLLVKKRNYQSSATPNFLCLFMFGRKLKMVPIIAELGDIGTYFTYPWNIKCSSLIDIWRDIFRGKNFIFAFTKGQSFVYYYSMAIWYASYLIMFYSMFIAFSNAVYSHLRQFL
jgi:hypothetical protein